MSGRAARSLLKTLRSRLRPAQGAEALKPCSSAPGQQPLRGFATQTASEAYDVPKFTPFRTAAVLAFAAASGYGVYHYAYGDTLSTAHLTQLQAHEHPHDIGTFDLVESNGKHFTERSVKKEFAVLLFGSLDHPEFAKWMEHFARAVYESDEKCNQEHLKPVILCLDAEKDTVEKCAAAKAALKSHALWKATFYRRVAIVTGEDVSKVHEAAHHFTKVFFGKHPRNTGTPESTDLGDIYLISPDGKFLEAYGLGCSTPEEISDDWARVQKAWNIHHPSWHGCRNVAKRYA
ncbi:hypothetical protein WJX73_010393 [Symbiochloris irregularis]|uniref:Uncharacterized protein n=1 Tax=Symbiochloris irregularis TaxID=706552 RepID=A0AAW1NMG6_9CHLO